MKSKMYDDIIIGLLADLFANDLNMVRDDNGDYELPQQKITREQLETMIGTLYEAATVTEIKKIGGIGDGRNKN